MKNKLSNLSKSLKKFFKSKGGKYTIGVILFIAYSVLLYYFAVDNYKAELAIKSAERQEFIEHLSESDHLNEDEEKLMKMMESREPGENTELLDLYFYYAGQYINNFFTPDEEIYLSGLKIDGFITSENLNDDDPMKERMLEIESMHGLVKHIQGTIITQIDYKYFIDTYKEKITQGYLDVLYLYEEEQKEEFYHVTSGDMFPNVVTKRLDMAYAGMTREGNEDVYEMMESAYAYYLNIYLGVTDVEMINAKNGYLLDEVLESYKTYEPKDEKLKTFMKDMLAKYEETNNMRTVEVTRMVNEYLGITAEENEEHNNELENNAVEISPVQPGDIEIIETESASENVSESEPVAETEEVVETEAVENVEVETLEETEAETEETTESKEAN